MLRRIVTGKGAHNLFLSPDGRVIWVNNRVAGTTEELDAKTLAPIRTFHISGGPDDLGFAPDGKLWITRRFAESVAVLDPVERRVTTIAGRTLPARHLPQPDGADAREARGAGLSAMGDPFDLARRMVAGAPAPAAALCASG